jgi:hypothetical protein
VFKPGPEDPERSAFDESALDSALDFGRARALACAACRRRITRPSARIAIAGRHEHTCTNPHGFRYRIGCFAFAEGLAPFGNPSSYWSWFPGFSWQVQNCGGCRALLGWLFVRPDERFYGLILDELVEIDEDA